jgi:lambda repressor-like predicted transcriptional regulator
MPWSGGMSESQKDAIRLDRQTMSGAAVSLKHGCTRQRVHQILQEPRNEARRVIEDAMGIEPYVDPPPVEILAEPVSDVVVRFRCKRHKKFEDLALQQAIRREVPNYSMIARKYGLTVDLVWKIRRVSI